MPNVRSATAPSRLLLGEKYGTLGRTLARCKHRSSIRRTNFVEMMKMGIENRSTQEGPQNFGKQQVGHRPQLVAGGRKPGDINSKPPQLLNQPPDFRPAGGYFLANFRSA